MTSNLLTSEMAGDRLHRQRQEQRSPVALRCQEQLYDALDVTLDPQWRTLLEDGVLRVGLAVTFERDLCSEEEAEIRMLCGWARDAA